jgi:hypothetical protein
MQFMFMFFFLRQSFLQLQVLSGVFFDDESILSKYADFHDSGPLRIQNTEFILSQKNFTEKKKSFL